MKKFFIEKTLKKYVERDAGQHYFSELSVTAGRLLPQIIADTVKNGDISVGWYDGDKHPSVMFSCPDAYANHCVSLVDLFDRHIQNLSRPIDQQGRDYRFLKHMQESMRQFLKTERQRSRR